jgi:hypothetical protein
MALDRNGIQVHPHRISKVNVFQIRSRNTRRLGMDSCIEHGESSLPAKAGLVTTDSVVVHLTSICGLLMTTSDSVFLDTASKRA